MVNWVQPGYISATDVHKLFPYSRVLGLRWMEPFPQARIEIHRLLAVKGEAPLLEGEGNPALWLERPSAWMQIQSQQLAEHWLYRAMRLRCGLMRRDIDHGNLMMLWYIQALQELEEMGADIQAILDF